MSGEIDPIDLNFFSISLNTEKLKYDFKAGLTASPCQLVGRESLELLNARIRTLKRLNPLYVRESLEQQTAQIWLAGIVLIPCMSGKVWNRGVDVYDAPHCLDQYVTELR